MAYHLPLQEIDYYNAQPAEMKNLFPLKERYKEKYKQAPYNNDMDLFFGNIS